jgi:hypothetical protein
MYLNETTITENGPEDDPSGQGSIFEVLGGQAQAVPPSDIRIRTPRLLNDVAVFMRSPPNPPLLTCRQHL